MIYGKKKKIIKIKFQINNKNNKSNNFKMVFNSFRGKLMIIRIYRNFSKMMRELADFKINIIINNKKPIICKKICRRMFKILKIIQKYLKKKSESKKNMYKKTNRSKKFHSYSK